MAAMRLGAAALGLCLAATDAGAEDTLRIATWGGAYGHAQPQALFDSFARQHPDITLEIDTVDGEILSGLRAVDRGVPGHDLVAVSAAQAAALCAEGAAISFDPDLQFFAVPAAGGAASDFAESLSSSCFIPQLAHSETVAYRTDLMGLTAPISACAIFDPVVYPGKRGIADRARGIIEWALFCDGVDWPDMYTLLETDDGLARALSALDHISGDIVWWDDLTVMQDLLSTGEISLSTGPNGRFFGLIARGIPVDIIWSSQVLDFEGWIVPTGVPETRRELISKFVFHATDPAVMAGLSRFLPFGPARQSAIYRVGRHARLDLDMTQHIPNSPEHIRFAVLAQNGWWAANNARIEAAFRAWRESQ